MGYKHLFVDSDILLDLLLNRDPFHPQLLLLEATNREIRLSTSALVIANINYILAKQVGAANSRAKIKELIKTVKVLSFEAEVIDVALDSAFSDFEDSIQNIIAVRNNCDAIITRNIKDYKQATIPVLTAEQFLRTLS